MQREIENTQMAFAIVVSIVSTFVFTFLFWLFSLVFLGAIDAPLSLLSFALIPVYFLSHIAVGLLFSELLRFLLATADEIYGFTGDAQWGAWSKAAKILVAAGWPITGLIGVPAVLAAILYGLPYRNESSAENNSVVNFHQRAA